MTAVYVRGRKLYSYDGTELAEIELEQYEYVSSLVFTEDGSGVRVLTSQGNETLVAFP